MIHDNSNNPAALHCALAAAKEFVESTDMIDEDVVSILDGELEEIWHIQNQETRFQIIQDSLLAIRLTVIERRVF